MPYRGKSHKQDDEEAVQLSVIDGSENHDGDHEYPQPVEDSKYAIHPLSLQFVDLDVEQRFFTFLYRDSGFVGGKLYSIMFLVIAVVGYFTYARGPWGGPDATIGSVWWIFHHIGTGASLVFTVIAWVEQFWPYREMAFVVLSLIHWPGFMLVLSFAKHPHAYHLAYGIGCTWFCAFTTQARISRQIIAVIVLPMLTLFVVLLLSTDYFQRHTHIEMLWWPMMVFPIGLLYNIEKRGRRSFQEKEVAGQAIEDCKHKTLVTRNMIARFFPPTPTKDLLQRDSGRSKFYWSTALVVTDIVGFTSYASRKDPNAVITMLTKLFRSIDNVAPDYGVEKVSTIGDAYFGAIFPPASLDKDDIAAACSNLMSFGCDILDFAEGLSMRIGVHVGDVVGGFVGFMPPKFDLFGRAVDHVKSMESSAPHGMAHASQAILDIIGNAGHPHGVTEQTEHGLACRQWVRRDSHADLVGAYDEEISDERADAIVEILVNMRDEDPKLHASFRADLINDPAKASAVRGTSCWLESSKMNGKEPTNPIDSRPQTPAVEENSDNAKPQQAADNPVSRENDNAIEAAQEVEDRESFNFHIVLLRFNRASVEKSFIRMIRTNNVSDVSFKIGILSEVALLVAHINMGCFNTVWDRAVTSVIAMIILLMVAYINFIGANNRLHALVTYLGFVGIFVTAMLLLRAECSDLKNQPYYVGNIIFMYYIFAQVLPQFIFDVQFAVRLGMAVLSFTLCVVLQIVRDMWLNDDSTPWDPLPLLMLVAGSCVSYVSDFLLRTAFGTKLRLSSLRDQARSKQAVMMNGALDIMLPQFVTERIVQNAKKASDESRSRDLDTTSQLSVSSGSSHDVAAVDFSNVSAVWEFNHVCVMFATFTFEGADVDYSLVRRTVNDMEDVVMDHGALKVKTIGSTMMCMLGIDRSLNPSEMIVKMVNAARAIQMVVLRPLAEKKLRATYSIGINCGPCFGAVIGDDGFIFDIFGDTVNVASRMMSTARNASIQLSARAQETLPLDQDKLRFNVEALPEIEVKGKGSLKVYGVTNRVVDDDVSNILSE